MINWFLAVIFFVAVIYIWCAVKTAPARAWEAYQRIEKGE